jgi:transmembrane sensor
MDKWIAQARQLGGRVERRWQDADPDVELARWLSRRRVRRRAAGWAIATALAAAITVPWLASTDDDAPPQQAPLVSLVHVVPPPSPDAAVPAPAPTGLALGDGSVVTAIDPASSLVARSVTAREVTVALVRGEARFEVPDRDDRRFVALLGLIAVETHGGAFRANVKPRRIEVVAERGRVVVQSDHRVIAVGETTTFTFPLEPPQRDAPEPPRDPHEAWRDAASRGDYAAAWEALDRTRASIDRMDDLLLAGDVARLSGHAAAAVPRLVRAMTLHPDDPRAPLAAFTLARVHLEELGAPREAARAFARARELAPNGPLAEDALAREVEAWSRAGETETAHARAVEYTQRYPAGRRLRAVRKFGGLDRP